MSVPPELLQSAIQAAQAGQRDKARRLFLDIVDRDPYQVAAWMYLSRLIDDPEDRLTALENALALRPGDPDLTARREALLLAYPALGGAAPGTAGVQAAGDEPFQMALRLTGAGRRKDAVRLLEEIVAHNPQDERAWQVLSEIHPDPRQKIKALEQVLALNPLNQEARQRLEPLLNLRQAPLQRGQHLEERGEFEQAALIYRTLMAHSTSPAERLEAQLRIDHIGLKQEAHKLQPVPANLNLARLALGPVLLFLLMLFMQSGLNPLRLPLLSVPGIASVMAGSLLVAVTEMRPAPAVWTRRFGKPGAGDEPEMRRGLSLLGWALLLAPYTMFLIEAGHRLGVLQAAMFSGIR